MRSFLAGLCATALLAGCATEGSSPPPGEGPSVATGGQIGEAGEPRNRAKLHTELAALYYSRGNMGVALEELRIAVAADGSYAPAHGMFGIVYQELKETKLAEQSFERALRLAPSDPDLNHNFGQFLCQNRREQDSIRYFMAAVSNPLYPTPWRSYSAAGQCTLRTNDVKGAEGYFQQALKLDPDDPPATLQMGQIRFQQGKLDEARRYVARFNKLVSPTAESLWLALRVERKLGARTSEASYATQLRRRFPDSPEYQALQRGRFD
jgi:type IV pilus assembly protein PilF